MRSIRRKVSAFIRTLLSRTLLELRNRYAGSRTSRIRRTSWSMEFDTIGFDLGKTVFHPVGLNAAGEVLVRRKFSRAQLLRFTASLRARLIGMEACGGSHFLGRSLRDQGRAGISISRHFMTPTLSNGPRRCDRTSWPTCVSNVKLRPSDPLLLAGRSQNRSILTDVSALPPSPARPIQPLRPIPCGQLPQLAP